MLCSFTDIAGLTQEEQSSIKNACAHGLFKGNHRAFAPKDSLTWAETLAVLSRISEANITEKTPRRQGYYDLALQKEWIQKADLEKMNRKITKENFVNVLYAFHLTTPNQNANEPTETEGAGNLIGGQKDAHGCYLGAGYRWNEEAQECQRSRENNGTGEVTEQTVLSGTARKLVSYSGMAVTGEYVLNFQDTNLSTKFCNFINGAYTLSGELMNGTLISTMMACIDPEQEALETAFSLDATKRAIEDDILTLTMKKGATFGWKALPLE
jgi:heat shock protein HslJ